MIPIVNKVYNLGTQAIDEDYKIAVVRISNIIAFIFLMTGVIYSVISAYLAPQLVNVCILLFVGSVFILLLNYLQFIDLSRFALNLLISLDVAIYHACIVQSRETLIVSIYIGQFVIAVLPWIYIDIREKSLLISALSITFLIFIAQPFTNEFLNVVMDSSIFRGKLFTIPTYSFSIAALLFCMYLLQYKNLVSDKSSRKLLCEIQIRNKEMEKQQEKLVKTLEENELSSGAEEKRNWIAMGLSEIGGLLRGNLDDNFYQKLVSTIAKFMKVNQVGFFTVEEDEAHHAPEKFIELKSCYAFDRNKYLKRKIEIGHGLVGQCYLEKEPIYLKEVPDSYVNITSGLGGSTPKCILISPLIYDGNVQGIIEIASFNELENQELEFVDRLSEALASFISGNKINMKTKELLERSQEQGEELHAQEEEMRQTMEEMQATQEEMKRKETEYIKQIAELGKEVESLKYPI